MVLFANDHNVLIMRGVTKHGLKRQVRFWPERGLIHCEDSLDNSYTSMSVRTFLHKVKALNDMLARSSTSSGGPDAALAGELQHNVERALDIAALAQVQGMPDDASARRAKVRERAKTFYTGSSGNGVL